MKFFTAGGNVGSMARKNRRDWLNGIAAKARKGMVTMSLDGRKGGIEKSEFEKELTNRGLGWTYNGGRYHIVSLSKAA